MSTARSTAPVIQGPDSTSNRSDAVGATAHAAEPPSAVQTAHAAPVSPSSPAAGASLVPPGAPRRLRRDETPAASVDDAEADLAQPETAAEPPETSAACVAPEASSQATALDGETSGDCAIPPAAANEEGRQAVPWVVMGLTLAGAALASDGGGGKGGAAPMPPALPGGDLPPRPPEPSHPTPLPPTRPDDTQQPGATSPQPGEPAAPQDPGHTEGPAQPQDPGHADDPVRPQDPGPTDDPAHPQDPGHTDEPIDPQEPGHTDDPINPQDPGHDDDPVHPQDPGHTDDPIDPQDPGHTDDPINPPDPGHTDDPINPPDPGHIDDPADPQDPVQPPDPVVPPEPIPLPPPLTLQLARDTGHSDADAITNDATIAVTGLAADATWEYSLDNGQTWRTGTGDAIAASVFGSDGAMTVLARQSNAGGTSGTTTLDFTLLTRMQDLDLLPTVGVQTTSTRTVDRDTFSTGVALTEDTFPLASRDVHELRLRIGGDDLDLANDRLLLDRTLKLDEDAHADDVVIGGLGNMAYRYDSATRTLAIGRTDGGPLSGEEAAFVTNGIRLYNAQARPHEGDRLLWLSAVDVAGNVSRESAIQVTVDLRVPSLDLNGAAAGLDTDVVTTSLAQPLSLWSTGSVLTHANPDATFRSVQVQLSGSAIGRDDMLSSTDGGNVTAIGSGATHFTVAGTEWRSVQAGDTLVFLLADGSEASTAQTQAMLASLTLQNTAAAPLQGARSYTITVVDHLDRTATATSTISYDTVGTVIDLNSREPGLDQSIAVTPGAPMAFAIGSPTRITVADDTAVVHLTLKFTSSVSGAFATDATRRELFGFIPAGSPDDLSRMYDLGKGNMAMDLGATLPGLRLFMEFNAVAGEPPTVTISSRPLEDPQIPFTPEQVVQILNALYYRCEANTATGSRTIEITATDRAGNVSAVAARTLIDVRTPDTPVVTLDRAGDSGLHNNDGVTAANGSDTAPLRLTGFAKAGSTVTVFDDRDADGSAGTGEMLGTAVAGSDGRWSLAYTGTALSDGAHRFVATADGRTSAACQVTIDTQSPPSLLTMGHALAPRPLLSGTTDANMAVTVEVDTDNDLSNGYEVRYATRSDATGHWAVDTATAKPASGLAHEFAIGDTVQVKASTADLAGNITVRTGSGSVAASMYSISDSHVIEGTSGSRDMVFMVTRSGDLTDAGSVRYALDRNASSASDLATDSGQDFQGIDSGEVRFEAGESSKMIRFSVSGDYYREVNEKLVVRLEAPAKGEISDGVGIGNINEIDINRLQAAYGLRDLNPRQNDFAIRVRRSSDNAEQDIGFDVNGELDRTALLDFVGRSVSDQGFVTRWYDQSGNGRDMSQTEATRQGVIVSGGVVVQRADGSAAISFNNGRNGTNNDYMVADGVAATDWKSAVVYAKVQSEGGADGTLFNLGDVDGGRLSACYPEATAGRGYVFDVNGYDGSARLTRALSASDALLGRSNDLVFEAHSGNADQGSASINYTDGRQVIFENGVRVISDGTLADQFQTGTEWKLAWHGLRAGVDTGYYQQAMYNEFLVFLDKEGTATPTVQSLLGTAGNDVLTYAGEAAVTRIDGLNGQDALYLSGAANLDFGAFSGGVKGLAQLWMDNGSANTLTLTSATVSANGMPSLTVRMDQGDAVVLDGRRIDHDAEQAQTVIVGSRFNDVLVSTERNDAMVGGAGADTFQWLKGQHGHDTVLDFTNAQGDRLDVTQLLQGFDAGLEAQYFNRTVDANGHAVLQIDADGHGDFAQADLTITLAQLSTTDAIAVLTSAGISVL